MTEATAHCSTRTDGSRQGTRVSYRQRLTGAERTLVHSTMPPLVDRGWEGPSSQLLRTRVLYRTSRDIGQQRRHRGGGAGKGIKKISGGVICAGGSIDCRRHRFAALETNAAIRGLLEYDILTGPIRRFPRATRAFCCCGRDSGESQGSQGGERRDVASAHFGRSWKRPELMGNGSCGLAS